MMDSSAKSPGKQASQPTPYRPVLWVAAATGAGVTAGRCLESLLTQSSFAWWWCAAVGALVLAVAWRRRHESLSAVLLLLASAAAGAAWHDWRWMLFGECELARYASESAQPTCVEVELADRVRISPPGDASPLRAIPARTMSEATVRLVQIRDGRKWRRADGWSKLRVAGALGGVTPGDRLVVFAQLALTPPALNPGQFDWAAAERRDGRLTELFCDDPRCVTVDRAAASAPSATRALHAVRAWCSAQLEASVAPRDVPLVLATLLGDQERLSDSTKDAFMRTGSIHLLVISGAHIAMLAGMVWLLAKACGLSLRMQVASTLAMVLLYAAIVGPEPSVIRATMLAVAVILALLAGRRASAGNLFGAAALAVMAINPSEAFRAGTQFSFLAVAVLILLAQWRPRTAHQDPLARLIAESRPWWARVGRRWARTALMLVLASVIVGVAMAPLVAYHFHVIAPSGMVLTPLASPLVALALGAGLGALTVGWLVPPLAAVFGAVCGGALHLTELLVLWAERAPGSYVYSNGPPAWWLTAFYAAIAALAVFPALRPHWRWQAAGAMFWLAVGYAAIGAGRTTPGELRCAFLSVGHGTCAVLELPSGQTILYDAGSLGSPETAHRTIASYLWSRGIDRIDAIVLSHADVDHYNGVPGLVERFPVGVAYVSPMMFDPLATGGDLAAPNYLRDVLHNAGVPLRQVWMGDRLRTADVAVTIEVLHPPREGVVGRDNANSLLLSVEYAGQRILLPGDLEPPGLEQVMADPPVDCDVLLAPHHGSEKSDPPGFAAWCTPEWVVMSGRRPERTLESAASYKHSGASVLHTALNGSVTCHVGDGGARVYAYRGSSRD